MSTIGRRGRGGRRARLTVDGIVVAAIGLLDARGLEALTMRALGARLGVAAMSLYRHLPGRDAVLSAVVERLHSAALTGVEPGPSWSESVTRFATAYRRVLLDHPHAVPLLAAHPLDPGAALPLLAGVLDQFGAAGIGLDDALTALQSVSGYVLGHALAQTGRPPHAAPAPEGDPDRPAPDQDDRRFAAGLQAMVAGFRQLLGSGAPGVAGAAPGT